MLIFILLAIFFLIILVDGSDVILEGILKKIFPNEIEKIEMTNFPQIWYD